MFTIIHYPIRRHVICFSGFGLIGLLDDGIKVVFKRNLGLTSLQKLVGQIIISILAFLLLRLGTFDTSITFLLPNGRLI